MSAESNAAPRSRLVPLALWLVAAALALTGITLGVILRDENPALVPSLEFLALLGFGAFVALSSLVLSLVIAPWSQPRLALRLVGVRWLFLGVAIVVGTVLGPLTVWALLRVRVRALERDVASLRGAIEAEYERAGAPPEFVVGSFGRVASGASVEFDDAQVLYLRCADSQTELTALVYDLGPAQDEQVRRRFVAHGADARRCELVVVLDASDRVTNVTPELGASTWRRAFDRDEWLAHAELRAAMAADLAWNERLAGCCRADVVARLGPPDAERRVRDTAWELQATFANHDVFIYRATAAYEPYMQRVGGWGHWCDNAWD